MKVFLFFCGPDKTALANHALALGQVLAAHGLADKFEILLLSEALRAPREARIAQTQEAVVLEFLGSPDPTDYQACHEPHLCLPPDCPGDEALEQMAQVLEGLGYVQFAAEAPLDPQDEAELLENLKDLGYL